MFKKDAFCKTCKLDKPARSKHCQVCNVCVEKFDHHCIWINQCVGVKNYRWFLLFLFFHILICAYGSVAGILIFLGEKHNILRDGGAFVNNRTGERLEYTMRMHLRYFVTAQEKWFCIVVAVCIAMVGILTAFLGYHFNLARQNKTTNESFKVLDHMDALDSEQKIVSALIEKT